MRRATRFSPHFTPFFFKSVRAKRSKVVRILATAYSDFDAAIAAVNSGAIYKYISKPWDVNDLEINLMRALEFFIVQHERDHLLKEKISAFHRIMMTDRLISLGLLASGLSHHLRNSLVAIKVFLDLAPTKLESEIDMEDLQDTDYWHNFYRSAQKQMLKTTELLDVLGAVPLHPESQFDEPVPLSAVIQEAFLQKSKQIEWIGRDIVISKPADEPFIRVNSKMMLRFFDLLLSSVWKQADSLEILNCAICKNTSPLGVKLTVSADSLTFPDQSLKHLFDPFFTKDLDSTDAGLNLLTCFFIVYHHGGQMSAVKKSSGRAEYDIFLPVDPQGEKLIQSAEEAFLNKVFSTELAWEKILLG